MEDMDKKDDTEQPKTDDKAEGEVEGPSNDENLKTADALEPDQSPAESQPES